MTIIRAPLTRGLPIMLVYTRAGERLGLLISTGAAASALDRRLELGPPDANGRRSVSLDLRPEHGPPYPLWLNVLEGDFPLGYDGVLGRDVLANCQLTIDADRLTLAI